jgi:hypothetical protein
MSRPEGTGTGRNASRSGLVVGLVVLLIIVLALLWISGTEQAPEGGDTVTTEIAPGTTLTEVPAGEIVDGFPEGLILEDDVVANRSYTINYQNQNIDQPVVAFMSSWTLEQNIEEYGRYLVEDGWEVTHAATTDEAPVTFFYATKGSQDVNITFNVVEGDGVGVTIAVANRK